jgi:hypothetical protein
MLREQAELPVLTVIVTGNPGDGFSILGPFNELDEAIEWAEESLRGEEWWTMKMVQPEGMEP